MRKGSRPDWWPEGEAWPPTQHAPLWSNHRGPGLIGKLFFLIFVLVLISIVVGIVVASVKLLSFVLPFLIVAAVVMFVVRRFGSGYWRPFEAVREMTSRLADGRYSERVEPEGPPAMRSMMQSMNQLADRLEHGEEQRRKLLADIGHELRTPLTVVRGELEAMIDGVHPVDVDHLKPLLEDVAVMERLLEDLRVMSLAEAGTLALHVEPTDVDQLLRDVADSFRQDAAGRDVEISVGAPDDLEAMIDPVRIREVLTNVVLNALRAMPHGGLLRLRGREADGGIELSVMDTGVGMSADDAQSMFERFNKGDGSNGMGLGLTISKDLVLAHGGTISLDSAPGHGTTVAIWLPTGQ